MNREVSHYVVTAHPPGGVLHSVKCNFLAKDSEDVVIGKSRFLEVRQLRSSLEDGLQTTGGNASPFPIILTAPINGRITSLNAFQLDSKPTALLFLTTDQHQYAVIGYNPSCTPHGMQTYASGSLTDSWNMLGSFADRGPILTVDPHSRCLVLHLYDGLVTVFPILNGRDGTNMLGPVWHARLEERTILDMTILHHLDPENTPPHLCLLHQDSRGAQHVTTHVIDFRRTQLLSQAAAMGQASAMNSQQFSQLEWLKKSRIDGGSSALIPVPARHAAAAAAPSSANTNNNTSPKSPSGGVVVLGQRQITFCALNHYKVMPIPPALILSWDALPPDISGMPRFLLGDEFGNLHMLTLITQDVKVVALQLDTLGSCTLSNTLQYLDHGLVFCGSTLGDSQLIQIHDEPIPVDDDDVDEGDAALELGDTTYLSVVEEYTSLGPIVDFDLVPMAGTGSSAASTNNFGQSQVVTASGTSKEGSLRVIRNGIGMREYASVELSGIQNMWSLRAKYEDTQDAYLVQSFVSETRVLGVSSAEQSQESGPMEIEEGKNADMKMEEEMESEVGGTLEEVCLPGLDSSKSTLYIGNVVGNYFMQITEGWVRLTTAEGFVVDTLTPENNITVASGNEAGQAVIALRGGVVLYIEVEGSKLVQRSTRQMDREVSCLDIHPFKPKGGNVDMDTSNDGDKISLASTNRRTYTASICAVGLWDDFTVRLLSLESQDLNEMLLIHLSTDEEDAESADSNSQGQRRNRNNMMARSLCLITLDFSSSTGSSAVLSQSGSPAASSSNNPGVDMLLVGLGDGTVVSFAVVLEGRVRVQSKKEVSLGTQRVNLVPLNNENGGSCVLATGDRPTVIYLAGIGGTSGKSNYNPKLCYSNVNLSPAEEHEGDMSKPHTQETVVF
ncbi:mono-functional DNA-alkylating methyl methanesulfonate [Nitzschia inconspicua]|uniref:Mono-functional DNA-alkylating methyl methanesulfonate n=1 Tax=Nitzschia inconspicua TaxID=303405 RepID=A0A9K3PRM7_9STRA|nr:mono-functional DNA-alkylating methyl methanesulfonate [Nitzschia inconspicua]